MSTPTPPAPVRREDVAATASAVMRLASALRRWQDHDNTRAELETRRAATVAVEAIDTALSELHTLRARLVGEIRVADDVAGQRVDALLAAIRAARQAGEWR